MTISEAIGKLDQLRHNTYTLEDKVGWLSRLDGMVKLQIIDTHKGGCKAPFEGYNEETDPNTVLLVPEPFDDLYLRWMEAQIDYHNGENNRFNSSILMFQSAWDSYAAHYNRTHMPRSRGRRFRF